LSAAEIIKRFYPKTRILLFSLHTLKEYIAAAQRLRLDGYVLKDKDGSALHEAVDAILQNKTYFPRSANAAPC